jgi:mRNA interferase YafQ
MLRNPRYRGFEQTLTEIVSLFLLGEPLPDRLHDHALVGEWTGCRECHLRPDLLLVYREDSDKLTLMRLGTHSDLFS